MLAAMSASPLKITNLYKSYGIKNTVLAEFNLEITAGEFVALVGINGAGKTTLIKAILDFISIDSGSIEMHGRPQTDYHSREHLCFLPEHFKPPYYLTGAEFLSMMSDLYAAGGQTEIDYYARSLELGPDSLNKPVRQYSKGMAQKLGLIAVLASGRNFMVLDEPMSGLDPKARHQFKKLLWEKKKQGATLFFSTHLLADVGEICDRMAVLHEGHVRFDGTPAECRQRFGTADLESAYMTCIEYDRTDCISP